jgi:anti-sigma factor RsiW
MTDSTHSTIEPFGDEELVAYLDGELDDEASRRIEERLRTDEAVRMRLQRLERTWQILETLPRREPDEALHRSTVEMLAVEVEGELAEQTTRQAQRRAGWWAAAALGFFLAGWLGVVAVDRLWPNPDEQLLRDLDVIWDVDAYVHADNAAFLRSLQERGLFVKDPETERAP